MSLFSQASVDDCFPQYVTKNLVFDFDIDNYLDTAANYNASYVDITGGYVDIAGGAGRIIIGKELSKIMSYKTYHQYQVDDRVIYNDSGLLSVYKCISAIYTQDETPDSDPTHWTDVTSDYEQDTLFGEVDERHYISGREPFYDRTIEFYLSSNSIGEETSYDSSGSEFRGLIHCCDFCHPEDNSKDFHMSLFNPLDEDSDDRNLFIRFPDSTEYSPLQSPFGYNDDTVIANTNIYEKDFRLRPFGTGKQAGKTDDNRAGFVTISIVVDRRQTIFYVNGNKKFSTFNGVLIKDGYSYITPPHTDILNLPPVLYWGGAIDEGLYPASGQTASGLGRNCLAMRCYDRALTENEIRQNALYDKNRDHPRYCVCASECC